MPVRLLTRYVVAELLKVSLITLTAMTLFMVLVLIAREALRQGLGLGALLRLIPYGLPEALLFAVPATTLLAVCTVFGRMSSDNEFVAIKSAGISPMVLVVPSLVLAFVVSLVAVWLNDIAKSWGEPGVRRVIVESIEQIAYRMLRARRSYAHDRFSIHVARVEGQKLIRPTLIIYGANGSPESTLTAREAELQRNPASNSLTIRLRAWTVEQGNFEFADDDEADLEMPLLEKEDDPTRSSSPSDLPLSRIPMEIENQRERLTVRKRALAALAAYQMLTGSFDELTSQRWKANQSRLSHEQHRLKHLQSVAWHPRDAHRLGPLETTDGDGGQVNLGGQRHVKHDDRGVPKDLQADQMSAGGCGRVVAQRLILFLQQRPHAGSQVGFQLLVRLAHDLGRRSTHRAIHARPSRRHDQRRTYSCLSLSIGRVVRGLVLLTGGDYPSEATTLSRGFVHNGRPPVSPPTYGWHTSPPETPTCVESSPTLATSPRFRSCWKVS